MARLSWTVLLLRQGRREHFDQREDLLLLEAPADELEPDGCVLLRLGVVYFVSA